MAVLPGTPTFHVAMGYIDFLVINREMLDSMASLAYHRVLQLFFVNQIPKQIPSLGCEKVFMLLRDELGYITEKEFFVETLIQ